MTKNTLGIIESTQQEEYNRFLFNCTDYIGFISEMINFRWETNAELDEIHNQLGYNTTTVTAGGAKRRALYFWKWHWPVLCCKRNKMYCQNGNIGRAREKLDEQGKIIYKEKFLTRASHSSILMKRNVHLDIQDFVLYFFTVSNNKNIQKFLQTGKAVVCIKNTLILFDNPKITLTDINCDELKCKKMAQQWDLEMHS